MAARPSKIYNPTAEFVDHSTVQYIHTHQSTEPLVLGVSFYIRGDITVGNGISIIASFGVIEYKTKYLEAEIQLECTVSFRAITAVQTPFSEHLMDARIYLRMF